MACLDAINTRTNLAMGLTTPLALPIAIFGKASFSPRNRKPTCTTYCQLEVKSFSVELLHLSGEAMCEVAHLKLTICCLVWVFGR